MLNIIVSLISEVKWRAYNESVVVKSFIEYESHLRHSWYSVGEGEGSFGQSKTPASKAIHIR